MAVNSIPARIIKSDGPVAANWRVRPYTHAADNTGHRVTSVETEQQPAERPRSRCDDLLLLG